MTIDESIANARKKANEMYTQGMLCHANPNDEKLDGSIDCAREQEQLEEWLEELKFLKQWKSDIMDEFCKYDVSSFEELVTNVRNKAIDDFANRISECLGVENATKYGNKNAEQQRMSYDTLMKYEIADAIEDIAEQLKAGDTDAESI